jgi:hypothetical protein
LPLQKSIASSFGGTSPIADKLLFQKLDPQHITPDYYGHQLLAKCSSEVWELNSNITFDDMKERYRCWPERTSTSPSGPHLSHYHALLKPDGLSPEDAEFDEIDSARQAVWRAHHSILKYSIRHGYSFTRWHQVVNAMIEREPGNPCIH